jgi:isopentenyl diphosphate isomerase/L-lactate dehydrogenase-like FMN-dependent dehydrogenase
MSTKLDGAIGVDDLRKLAKRRLPRPVFDMIDGGADDESTMAANRTAFAAHHILPRVFAYAPGRDSSLEMFGERTRSPILLAPTGAARIVHRDAEVAVARAARARETRYVHGVVSGFPLQRVAAEAGPMWFQLYLTDDRERTDALLRSAADCGVTAIVITVDVPVFGMRERDHRNRLTIPIRFSAKTAARCLTKPAWAFDLARGSLPQGDTSAAKVSPFATQREILASLHPVTLEEVRRVRERWRGPLLVKGVLRPDDAVSAVDAGVDGVIVSNHGGRQLNRSPATIDALPGIVAAVGERTTVLFDGGIRRGTDVLIALALGARAVLVGRPYLYGLAAGGQAGVERAIEILDGEFDRAMALAGFANLAQIDSSALMEPAPGSYVPHGR